MPIVCHQGASGRAGKSQLLTIQFKATLDGKRAPSLDWIISIYLSYYNGRWTVTRHEVSAGFISHIDELMLAIDKVGDE